jgi:hypothetical protein
MVTTERRRQPRFPFHSKGVLIVPDRDYRGALIDISVFGALFEADYVSNVAAGALCRLEVLNVDGSSLFDAEGVVSHAESNRVGIAFAPMDEDRKEKIRSIAHLNLAPPSVVERPLHSLL